MNKQKFEDILQRSPTGGNSKPFGFLWSENNNNLVTIFADKNISQHYLNRNNHGDYLGFGCLMYLIYLESLAQNLQFEILNLEEEPLFLKIQIQFNQIQTLTENQKNHLNLYTYINQRSTYRQGFKFEDNINLDLFHSYPRLTFFKKNDYQLNLHFCTAQQVTSEFKKYLIQCEAYIWSHKQATKDVLNDIRFGSASAPSASKKRKIPVSSFKLNFIEEFFIKFLQSKPQIGQLLIRMPLFKYTLTSLTIKNIHNSHFFLVSTSKICPESLIEAGALAMQTWLLLESQNLKAQPFSGASINLVDAFTNNLPNDTLPSYFQLFNETGPALFKSQFNLTESERPVWMFRLGKPSIS